MGKRSNFERNPRDFYPTPLEAIAPLIPHLPPHDFTFAELSAGDGALIDGLKKLTDYRAKCVIATDIEPQQPWIKKRDAFDISDADLSLADFVIMNPPWDRKILHPMIDHFAEMKNTWLLFDANWLFTKQASPYMAILHKVVTIGRVKWIPGSKMTGKDDCCWFNFRTDARDLSDAPLLFGKGGNGKRTKTILKELEYA